MTLDVSVPARILAAITDTPEGCVCRSSFAGLQTQLQIASNGADPDIATRLRMIHRRTGPLLDDVLRIAVLPVRLELQLEQHERGTLDPGTWFEFTALDMEFFFILFRSALDHVANVIESLASKPNQLPRTFSDLRKFVAENTRRAHDLIGPELVSLTASASWFEEFRTWRGQLVHEGAMMLAFYHPGKLLFQITQGISNKIEIAELMFNANVVDFRRFMALYYSRLLSLIDDLATVAAQKLSLDSPVLRNTRWSGSGVAVLRNWLNDLIRVSEEASPG